MKCPDLDVLVVPISKVKLLICKESERTSCSSYYSPTVFQLQQFCRKDNYKRCPFLLKMKKVA